MFESITSIGLSLFFIPMIIVIIQNTSIFTKRYGRSHRIVGFIHFIWLLIGYFYILIDFFVLHNPLSTSYCISYHLILNTLGILSTLSAARDFKRVHEKVKNIASGTLDESATVTYAEMIEHSFYQLLNLLQIIYIHSFAFIHFDYNNDYYNSKLQFITRFILLVIVTLPWIIRYKFPVHSFSDNYKKSKINNPWTMVNILYRIKKYQYVFYKHVLLHGLNIYIAISGSNIGCLIYFRLYWLALNTSYVMEFFMQTLVKKKVISQNLMLILQRILMLFSTTATIPLLLDIPFLIPILSCILNFKNRGHDFMNVLIVYVLFVFYYYLV